MTANKDLDLTDLTTEDLNRITRSVKKAKQGRPYKHPGNKFEIYLKPDWADHLKECKEYAYRKHMIKTTTDYAFGSWAAELAISSIIAEIRRERTNPPLKDNLT